LQLAAVEEFAGNPRAARRWLEDAVARAPFDPEVWRQLSLVSAQLGDSGRALEEAVRAASLSPTRRR
jgi:Tfp pilus assembly protein PilF